MFNQHYQPIRTREEIDAYRKKNLDRANQTLAEASNLAKVNGWKLTAKINYHFQLIHLKEGWVYDLYPGNQRIVIDPEHNGKFLPVEKPWTFIDVVKLAIEKNK